MADEKKNLGETIIGYATESCRAFVLFFGFITGLVFYFVEKKNKFVRFHAMQSIVVFGSFFVANLVLLVLPVLGVIIGGLLSLLSLVLWILLMIKAYQGEMFKLPIAGDIAEKNS